MIKIKNYTQEDLDYIKANYEISTIKQIAEVLNKEVGSISNAVRKLGLKKQEHKPWTREEIEYIKSNYIKLTSEEMANILNRTVASINTERDRLGLVRKATWSDDDIKFLQDNFNKMSHEEIGRALGRTRQAITAKCFDLSLYKKEKPWEDYEIQFLRNNYMEMSKDEIVGVLNRTYSAIQLQASRMGMKKYPYFCDYHYFENINTEEKAYWLGFLSADGWINKNEKSNAGVVGIELQYSDIDHLKKFNKSISGNYKIDDRWRACSLSTKDKNKKQHMCIIRIFSLTMYQSLVKLGFTNDKSYDFNIPNLNRDLLRHYMRGYFDGDGCFTLTNKTFHINFITASERLNNDIVEVLRKEDIYVTESSYVNEFGTTMFRPSIYRNNNKLKFLDWIYRDCTIYLDRKYNKYLKAKNDYRTQSLAV